MKTRVIQDDPREPGVPSERSAGGVGASGRPRDRSTGITGLVRRHPLPAFFLLAFALTWASTPFGVFMAGGPLLAALLVTALVDGRRGLRELGSRVIRWRVGWQWYAAALLIPLGLALGTGGLNVALGAPDAPVRDLEISALFLMFALRLVVPIFSPMGEEPGWRGFALPRMLVGRSPFAVTVVLGLIVAVWHVPLVFIESEDLAPIFLLTTVAVTFFYTWLFINTGGSVFITILAHAMEGVISRDYVGTDGWAGADESHWTWLYTAAWCAVAVLVVALDRKFWRARAKDSADPVVANPALAGAR